MVVVIFVIAITSLLWSSTHVQERVPIVVQVLPTRPSSNAADLVAETSNLSPEISNEDSADPPDLLQEEVSGAEENVTNGTSRQHEAIKIRCRFLDETSLQVD